jgi:hypothetical protein
MEILRLLFQTGWILLGITWAYGHFKKIEYKKLRPGSVLDYSLRVWFACLFAGASMITIAQGNVFDYFDCYWCFINLAGDLLSKAGIFSLVFNISLNIFRPDKKWNYISTTNGKFFDEVFKGNFNLQLASQLLIIAIGELTYYLI